MSDYVLIVNRKAGQGKASRLSEELAKLFQQHDINFSTFYTNGQKDASNIAKRENEKDRVIVAIGGDGTVFEIINGMAPSFGTLAVVPGGTANILAKELALPERPKDIFDMLKSKKTTTIDLGAVNSNYFSLMTGIGFDAIVISEVRPALKQIFRKLAFPLTGLKTFRSYDYPQLKARIDKNTEKSAYFIVVSNASRYGGDLIKIAKEAHLSDGFLDVTLFEKGEARDFLKYTLAVLAGQHLKLSDVYSTKAKEVEIFCEKPILVQADGEVIDNTPVKVKVLPKALKIIVPGSSF